MRAQIKKRQRNRRMMIVAIVVVLGVILVVGAYYLSTLGTPLEKQVGQTVSSADYSGLNAVAQSSYGNTNQSLMKRITSFSGQPYTSGGKPVIIYIGADYCPYCAFQRWPLIMALMRFGNFTNLSYMLSSSTDVYPDSPTFTFYGSSYKSNYIVFQGFEQEDRSQGPLMTVPSNYTGVFSQFGSSYPFIDFGNRYTMSGSLFFPDQLDGKNWTQIIHLLSSNSTLSNEVITSENAMTAAICKVATSAPISVCGNGSVQSLTVLLTAYHPTAGTTTSGTLLGNPSDLGKVQASLNAWVANAFDVIRGTIGAHALSRTL
jgi:uncharacterized protein DUF929